jgi:hypothetical protein
MESAYNLDDLIKACADSKQSTVIEPAPTTARRDFTLNSKKAILDFVSCGGLENPTYINTELWENNKVPATPILVDAYGFYSGAKYGYIAFLYSPITKMWIIKSFKLNNNPDPRNRVFAEKLKGFKVLASSAEMEK